MKYTKGPWKLELRKKDLPAAAGARHRVYADVANYLILVAETPAHRGYAPGAPLCLEECEANARLLYAAPDLLEALEALVAASSYVFDTHQCECGEFEETNICDHVQAARALAHAKGDK